MRGKTMEHLLEVRWDDPIAEAVARILARVPEGVEQTTGQMPQGQGRAFGVYRSESLEVLEDLARAAASVGARVWITSITGGASTGSA
ncbi:MAG: hypothetical protein A3J45_01345 [Candidatus Rokubacteria bacterium RIFCSPHIGHO2_02_FULL_69_13]|nr:MAG: hypothetical protein A3J45_01345 [Candidatus Rokubacteria bacterium RIFCSPHIGHO2_02_FULL_69_13]